MTISKDQVALTVHFDTDGKLISAEYPGGRGYPHPVPTFEESPLMNTSVWRVESVVILVYEERDQEGNLVRRVGPVWQGKRYC